MANVSTDDYAALVAHVEQSRIAQGLPARVSDPAVLRQVASLLITATEGRVAPRRVRARPATAA